MATDSILELDCGSYGCMQMLETVACGIGLARSGLRRGACALMLPLCTTSTAVVALSPGLK